MDIDISTSVDGVVVIGVKQLVVVFGWNGGEFKKAECGCHDLSLVKIREREKDVIVGLVVVVVVGGKR